MEFETKPQLVRPWCSGNSHFRNYLESSLASVNIVHIEHKHSPLPACKTGFLTLYTTRRLESIAGSEMEHGQFHHE